MIRLTIPSIDEQDLAAVREVLLTGFLVQGANVARFEEAIARYVGCEHAVAVSNGTAALLLSLMALEIGAGDKVAVATYSWPATANVIALCGAEPVFVDVDPRTFNMVASALEHALSTHRVKAILPVHTFGGMADMPALSEIAERFGVAIIEDAACALGAEWRGRKAGTWGTMGCFSFHPRKAITTGEGGLITTNDTKLARRLRALRNHGLDPECSTPDFILPGHNMRLTEFQAALGASQMTKLERIIASRRGQAKTYARLLGESTIEAPEEASGQRHVYQSFVVLLPPAAVARRSEIISGLKEEGIETTVGTYHIPMTSYFRSKYGFSQGDFPVTDDVASRAMSLPLYEGLTENQQQQVVDRLKAWCSQR